jgi:multidrug efflux system membrane fusion protein
LFISSVLVAIGGCQPQPTQVAPPEPPVLPVSKPVQREVTDFVDFTGRTDAVEAVDIRPRVTGYLVRMPFKEGSEVRGDDRLRGAVRLVGLLAAPLVPGPLLATASLFPGQCQEGSLLFEIDPRPYHAQLDQAEGQVKLNEASLKLARATYERDRALANAAAGAVSRQQLDQDVAAVDEAAARVQAVKASTEVYKLNLEFTKVTSPIDGMVSRYYLTAGNLVNQDQTLLTTVVSLDPIYVYFDMDEPTLLRFRKARNAGAIKPAPGGQIPVLMGLQGEDSFPHRGTVNFVNNQVNPATGSIAVRGVFPNPKPDGGTRLMSPGMFVRVRLPISQPHPALLVIDRAIGSDQGLKFVYVVDAEHKVQYRRVTTGPLQEDGLRVITQGLNADDWVLVGGLPQVRPHLPIQPEPRAMPTLGQAPPEAAPAGQDTQPTSGNKPEAPARGSKQ